MQDVSQTANTAARQVSGYVSKANQQAQSLTTNVVNKATAFWNCLYGTFS